MNRFSLEHDGRLLEVETERAGIAKDVARLFVDGQQATERTARFGGPAYLEHGVLSVAVEWDLEHNVIECKAGELHFAKPADSHPAKVDLLKDEHEQPVMSPAKRMGAFFSAMFELGGVGLLGALLWRHTPLGEIVDLPTPSDTVFWGSVLLIAVITAVWAVLRRRNRRAEGET